MLQGDGFGFICGDFTGSLWTCGGILLLLSGVVLLGAVAGCIAAASSFAVNGEDGTAFCVNFVVVFGVVSRGDEFNIVLAASVIAVEVGFGEADVILI